MKKVKTANNNILEEMTLKERYNAIASFLISTFRVTNHALPSMAVANPIMCSIVLKELNNIDSIITNDIKSSNIKDIDLIDITTIRSSEISQFIYETMIHTNPYNYKRMVDDIKANEKAQRLEIVFPLHKREERLKGLENDISVTEKMMDSISEIDDILAESYRKKLSDLQREYDAIKETIIFKDLEEIKEETLTKVLWKLQSIQEQVRIKIEFLENVKDGIYE